MRRKAPTLGAHVALGWRAIWLVLLAVAYFFAHELALLFPDPHKASALWPAGGIGLAALLLSPRSKWLAIILILFLVGALTNQLSGQSLLAGAGFATVDVAESLACAWLISLWCGPSVRFRRVKEVLALIVSATAVNAFTALLGAAQTILVGASRFWEVWLIWWIADGLGILLIAPLVIVWADFREWLPCLRWRLIVESGLFMVVWCVAVLVTFQPAATFHAYTLYPYMLVGLLAWPALRFGQRGVTFALVVLASIAVTSTAVSIGPTLWGGLDPVARLLAVQVFIAFTAATSFLLAAAYSEAQIAARASREDQARLRSLGDNLPNGVVYQLVREVDGSHRFHYLSAGIKQLTGVSVDEALSNPAELYALVSEEDRLKLAVAEEASAGKMQVFDIEVRVCRRDGEVRWMHLCSTPRRLPDGRLLWDGIQTDISDRKSAEEEREKLQAQLIESQRMEAIGRLAGGVAHDFNNLLTVINGYSDLALGKLSATDPLRTSIVEIYKAGGHATELTQKLLAFSRKQVLQPRLLDVNRMLGEMQPMLDRLVGEDVEVSIRLHPEATIVQADEHQLEQVVMNLAANARDAMPRGGRIVISTAVVARAEGQSSEEHTALGTAPNGNPCVVLAVTDGGTGMDEETRLRIFEPFFTTKAVGKGTGLGLSMVHGIVEQSGGHIEVTSEPEQGTTFTIYLPRVTDATSDTEEPDRAPVRAIGGTQTVLVVEDQAAVRVFVADALRAYGYRVLPAENASDALALCEQEREKIDLVLTDVVMPNLSGKELADRLQQRWPGIKVLFMSGYAGGSMHPRVLDNRAPIIQKPFSPHQLAIKVRDILEDR